MANPLNTAPLTKQGGKMVVCQPGITEVAKSKDTTECTENTSGVAMPASTRLTSSKRVQALALPVQPKLSRPWDLLHARLGHLVADGGEVGDQADVPEHERHREVGAIANTSHSRGC